MSRYNDHSAHAIAQLTARTDIADVLEQFGAKPEPLSVEDPFRVACGRRDRELADRGADPEAKEDNWQATPLGMALHHQHWPVVDVLVPISHNLFDVCQVANTERAALLLARDPTLTQQRTLRGHTPLHVVSQAKQDDPDFNASVATIELLLKYGADPKALNNEGQTPAQRYRQLGMDEVADYMMERLGAD